MFLYRTFHLGTNGMFENVKEIFSGNPLKMLL